MKNEIRDQVHNTVKKRHEEKFRDHDLTGDFKGCRECHVEPDWLLIYEVIDEVLVLMLYRVGTH